MFITDILITYRFMFRFITDILRLRFITDILRFRLITAQVEM